MFMTVYPFDLNVIHGDCRMMSWCIFSWNNKLSIAFDLINYELSVFLGFFKLIE